MAAMPSRATRSAGDVVPGGDPAAAWAGPAVPAGGGPDPGRAVPGGPVAYRRSLQRLGPLMGCATPAALAVAGLGMLRYWPCDGVACVKPGLAGWFALMLAAPTTLVLGMPYALTEARMAVAVVTSVALWLMLGWWAGRRSTRSPVASWRDWWREYAVMAAGTWLGQVFGLAVTAFVLLR